MKLFWRRARALALTAVTAGALFLAGSFVPMQPFVLSCEDSEKWLWQKPMREDALRVISEALKRDGWRHAIVMQRVWTAPLQWSVPGPGRYHTNWISWRLNSEHWLVESMARGQSLSGRAFEPPAELTDLRNGGLPRRGLSEFVDTSDPRERRRWSDCHLRHAAFIAE
jgi:hypothetical protein